MAAGNNIKSGAAYEAVLTDNVSPRVEKIVKSLDRLEQAFRSAVAPADQLNKSMKGMTVSAGNLGGRMPRLTSRLDRFKRTMQGVAAGANNLGQAIGQPLLGISAGLNRIGLAATGAAAAIGAFFTKATSGLAHYESAVETAGNLFGDTAEENIEWAKKWGAELGMVASEAIQAQNTMRGLASGFASGADADRLSRVMTQLAADLAEGGDMATFQEGFATLRSLLSGEGQVGMRYGILLKDTHMKEFAERTRGIKFSELTESEKQLLRLESLLDQMAAMNWIGKAQKEAGMLTGQLRRMRAQLTRIAEDVGRRFKPQLELIVSLFNQAAMAIGRILSNVNNIKTLFGTMLALGTVGPALMAVALAFSIMAPVVMMVASSIVTMISALSMAMTIAPFITGPILGLVAGVTILGAILAAITLYSMEWGQMLQIVANTVNDLTDDFFVLVEVIRNAFKSGDWNLAWKAAGLYAEIVIRELAKLIIDIMYNVASNVGLTFMRMWDGIKQYGHSVLRKLATGKGVIPHPSDLLNNIMGSPMGLYQGNVNRIEDVRRELRDLLEKSKRAAAAAEKKAKQEEETEKKKLKESPGPEDKGYVDATEEAMEKALKPIRGNFRSMGGFSATFGAATGLFGPQVDPIVSNTKEMVDEQKKSNISLEALNEKMDDMDVLRFM